MNADAGRRTFVRNMVVAVPALAGTVSVPAVVRGASGAAAPAAVSSRAEAGIEAVLRQMAALHNEIRRRQPTIDDARTASSYLRTLSAYRQEGNRDLELSRAMRELIAREGTERLSRLEPSRTLVMNGLAHYGVSGGRIDFEAPSTRTRLEAIETIAKDGATRYYDELTYVMESINAAETVDPNLCDALREMTALLEAMAATMCLGAAYLPVLIPECFAASVVLTMLKLMNLLAMC